MKNIINKLKRNRMEYDYYTAKSFLNAMLVDMRNIGRSLGFSEDDIMDDIKEEILEVMEEQID